MATLTRYVNPDADVGGDGTTNATTGANCAYKSLSIAEAAAIDGGSNTGDLDTNNNLLHIICETGGTADTTAVVVDGYTTSATDYVHIYTSASHRHAGVWDDAKYRLVLTSAVPCVDVRDNYLRVTGLQCSVGSTNSVAGGIFSSASGNAPFLVDSCLVRAVVAATGTGIGYASATVAAHQHTYVNNIVYGFTGVGAFGIYTRANGAGGRAVVYNNTVYNCTTGFRSRDANVVWKNNLAIGCTDAYLETTAAEIATYNAYDEGTDPGTNGIDLSGSSDAAIFTDATVSNFTLVSGSTAADVGVSLASDSDGYYSFSTDITGATRSGTWDVGADEYIAAGGASHNLSGSLADASSISGSLAGSKPISGSLDDSSAISASVAVARTVSGSLSSACEIAGTLTLQGQVVLAGSLDSASTIAAALQGTKPLSGSLTSGSTIVGSLDTVGAQVALVGSLSMLSAVSASLGLSKGCAGIVVCSSSVDATMRTAWALSGAVSPQSALSAVLSIQGQTGNPFRIFAVTDRGFIVEATARTFTFDYEKEG